ncbi:hypothetical protein PFISCL1PPCAC_17175, partial [Pristionchus fissidentatus]
SDDTTDNDYHAFPSPSHISHHLSTLPSFSFSMWSGARFRALSVGERCQQEFIEMLPSQGTAARLPGPLQ